MFFPAVKRAIGIAKVFGMFSGFNGLALVLVFLLVEETKKRSPEDLDLVFAVSKGKFMKFQVGEYLPWFIRRYMLYRATRQKPSLYEDMIWGEAGPAQRSLAHPPCDIEMGQAGTSGEAPVNEEGRRSASIHTVGSFD